MKDRIELREIVKEDLSGFGELFPNWKPGSAEKKLKKTLASKKIKRFVAISKGKIIGHAKCILGKGRHIHIAELYSLVVLPEHRGKGIGTSLIQHTEEQMPDQIKLVVFQVQADNENAINLYKKLGFEQYGFLEKASLVDGKLADNILMKKEIQ